MMPIIDFIKRRPLLTFCVLVFAISWGGMLVVLAPVLFTTTGELSEQGLFFAYLAMLAGPAIAGILLTGIVDGRAGLRDLAARLLKWRVGGRWYAAALLIAPVVILAVLLVLAQISFAYLPRLYTTDDRIFLVQFSIISALLVGILEELGWTGFATELLLKRKNGILKTGLVVGVLYAAWNFLVVFSVSSQTAAAGELPMVVFMPLVLFTWLPTFRVLMVWVYSHTRSLLVAMLMHTSLVTFWTCLTPLGLAGMPLVTYYLVVTVAFWVVIAIVAAANRWQLTRQPLHHGIA